MKRSSKFVDFPGQISIFEYLESLSSEKPSDEGYLEKGERLTTLARKKFERMMDGMKFTDLEKTIFSVKIPEHYYLGDIVNLITKEVVRPLIKAMTTFDERDSAYKSLKEVIDFDFTLKSAKGLDYYTAYKYLKRKHHKTDDQLILTIREEGWPNVEVLGYRAYGLPKGKKGNRNDLIFTDDSMATDIALILSWLLCLSLYNRAIADENMEEDIREAFTGHLSSITELYGYILKRSGIKSGLFYKDVPVYTPQQKYKTPNEGVLRAFTKASGMPVSGRSRWADDVLQMLNRDEESKDLKPRGYLLPPAVEWYLVLCDPIGAFREGIGRVSYNTLLDRRKCDLSNEDFIPQAWARPYPVANLELVATYVLRALWKKKGSVAKILTYYDDLRNEIKRAKVWQTKRNIPQKMIKNMEESMLNRNFGYVEFDESCDANSLTQIAAEFNAFKDRRLSLLDLSNVSIRFRLLGNYKAAGLYFPNINCLCVDVRHPSSFLHELGHGIDYLYNRLSERKAFSTVYGAYKRAFLSGDNLTPDKRLHLFTTRSKYNIDYYFLPTEVFARCMEMYVTRVLREDLSICKLEDEMNWAYPNDELMMEQITEYFDCLFFSLNNATYGKDIMAA